MSRSRLAEVALCISLGFILCVHLGTAVPTTDGSDEPATTGEQPTSEVRPHFRLPKLFQFDHYKTMFKKQYASVSEELIRQKIFLARAFRAFISGISFKFRKVNYFLALNPFSDWTNKEIEQNTPKINPMATTDDIRMVDKSVTESPVDTAPMISLEDVQKGLQSAEKLAAEKGESGIAKELENLKEHAESRRRRSVDGKVDSPREDFSFNQLIDRPETDKLSPEAAARLDRNPQSNNPNYVPPEATSMGFDLQIKPFGFEFGDVFSSISPFEGFDTENNEGGFQFPINPLKPFHDLLDGVASQVTSWLTPPNRHIILNDPPNHVEEDEERNPDGPLPDKVFVDHGKSGCMFPAKAQKGCGACYAFAATTFFEWLHCNTTGKLTRFSEQYMVDCGGDKLPNKLMGCNGGFVLASGKFFQEYGAEAGLRYPYVAKEGKCPYDTDNSTQMGFIRFNNDDSYVHVPVRLFDKYVKFAPMIIAIGTKGDFLEYGGGIHSGEKCCQGMEGQVSCGTHAVLLIGHGRQDGEEYWLIRNSHSAAWGEKGNYKLSKKGSHCIDPPIGTIFGTEDGHNIKLEANINPIRPKSVQNRIRDKMRYGPQVSKARH